MRLKDKVAIVTGGTSGMGRAIATLFAAEGAKVTIVGRDAGRINQVQKTINSSGGKCLAVMADMEQVSKIKKVVEGTITEFGKLDILVNCAGIFPLTSFSEVDEDFYDRVMNTNLKSVFFLSQLAAKEMAKQGKGKIVNVSSVGGEKIGFPGASVYCVSKGGITSLTTTLAVELAPMGICVNNITPGEIKTPMNEQQLADPSFHDWIVGRTPLRRVGEPKDVIYGVLYLASDESDFVTGAHLVIDGGLTSAL